MSFRANWKILDRYLSSQNILFSFFFFAFFNSSSIFYELKCDQPAIFPSKSRGLECHYVLNENMKSCTYRFIHSWCPTTFVTILMIHAYSIFQMGMQHNSAYMLFPFLFPLNPIFKLRTNDFFGGYPRDGLLEPLFTCALRGSMIWLFALVWLDAWRSRKFSRSFR